MESRENQVYVVYIPNQNEGPERQRIGAPFNFELTPYEPFWLNEDWYKQLKQHKPGLVLASEQVCDPGNSHGGTEDASAVENSPALTDIEDSEEA